MSTAALEAPARAPRLIPAEISNWIASFWLTLGFGVVLMLLLWPEVGNLAGFLVGGVGRTFFLLLVGGLVGVGGYVTIGVLRADANRFRLGKLFLLIALIVGALAAIGVIVIRMQAPQTMDAGLQSPTFWGASPTLAALLLVTAFLLPLFFGVMALSMGGQAPIKNFFNPPEEIIEPELEDEGPRTRPMKPGAKAARSAAASAASVEVAPVEDEVVVVEDDAAAVEESAAAAAPHDSEAPLAVDSDFEISLEQAEAKLGGDKTQATPVKPVMPDEVDAPLPAGEFDLDDEKKS